jgi:antitoxin component of MazEF toxin-antitoxin module
MKKPVKVRKWGRSLAVRIPCAFAKERGIGVGTVVDLKSVRVVKSRRRRYTLAELMARFKPDHRHGEWDLGHAVGREIW